MSINGTGFDTAAANDLVTFGLTRAVVTAATTTALTVTVPDAATSGKVTVAVGVGSPVQSSADFIVVPHGYIVAKVGTTGVLTADGTPTTVNITTASTVALLRFTGVKGERLSLGLTGSTITTDFTIGAFTPYGAPFARQRLGYDQPWPYTQLYGGGLDLPPLPSSGVYQIVIDPGTATGSVLATLSSRVTGTLSPTGSGVTVNLARPGQQAELTFPATAGQPLDLGFLRGTLPSGSSIIAGLRDPNGATVFWGRDGAILQELDTDGGSDWDFTPTATGAYTLLFGTRNSTTGTLTVTQSQPLAPVAVTLGTPVTVAVNRSGQDARLTFAGTAGQTLALDFTSYPFAYLPVVTLTGPDGTALTQTTLPSLHWDLPALPSTGTYTITVSPGSTTGTFTARLAVAGDAGTVTTTGPPAMVNLPASGAPQTLTFTATAGQPVDFAFGSWTLPATATVTTSITDPTGTLVYQGTIGSLGTLRFAPGSTGTFHLALSAASAGSTAVTMSAETAGGALTVAATKTVTSSRAGQGTRFTFAGTAGQRLSLALTSYAYTYTQLVTVLRPDGTVLRNGTLATTQLDLDPLPATGTYQIILTPFAETGSTGLTVAQRDTAGTAAIDGAATTLTMNPAGHYAEASFTATAGQRLSFGFTGRTFPATTGLRTRVVDTNDTAAYGTTSAQTTTITRDPTSNRPTAYVDQLSRRTQLTYDTYGNLTGITQLAGSASARTATFTYGPYDQLTKATDWLGHATTDTYTTDGAVHTITDAVGRTTTVDTAENGQLTKVTDSLGNATTYTYRFGDPATSTDPLGHVRRTVADGTGQITTVVNAAGSISRIGYNKAGQITSVTDPLGRTTSYQYDPNGNLTKVTDPLGHATAYTYTTMDRLATATDALNRVQSVTYDANGNIATATSARGKQTTYSYDALDRLTTAKYGVSGASSESQTTDSYDAGNRITSITDSTGGTITLTENTLDEVTRAVTPQGQIDYTFDAAGRRTGMTVAGQTRVVYGYNNADQLTNITKGTTAVSFGYDGAGRLATTTLPDTITQTYAYDAASRLVGITYAPRRNNPGQPHLCLRRHQSHHPPRRFIRPRLGAPGLRTGDLRRRQRTDCGRIDRLHVRPGR